MKLTTAAMVTAPLAFANIVLLEERMELILAVTIRRHSSVVPMSYYQRLLLP